MLPKLIKIDREYKGHKTIEYATEKESFDPRTGNKIKSEIKIDPDVLADRKTRLIEEIEQIEGIIRRINENKFDETRQSVQRGKTANAGPTA